MFLIENYVRKAFEGCLVAGLQLNGIGTLANQVIVGTQSVQPALLLYKQAVSATVTVTVTVPVTVTVTVTLRLRLEC